MNLTLPDQLFFQPKPVFLDWLDTQPPHVIDVGAGVGLLGSLRPDKVVCFDICPRANPRCHIYPVDATDFKYPSDCVVLMCRPCMGPWIRQTWSKVLGCGARMFYVGVERNFQHHLTEGIEYEIVLDDVGLDNEKLIEIKAVHDKDIPETV